MDRPPPPLSTAESLSRREFLAAGGAAVAAAAAPAGAIPAAAVDRTLVAIQVAGGWDYLSMLIPADDPVYARERPSLRIPRAATLPVEAAWDWRWHPALQPLRELYDRGDLAIVENIGYPGVDLSHFESIDKWHSADPTGALRSGWLGRYLLLTFGPGAAPALDIEPYPSSVFAPAAVPALLDAGSLALSFDWGSPEDSAVGRLAIEANAQYAAWLSAGDARELAERSVQAHRYAEWLRVLGRGYAPRAAYPDTRLARDLQLAARLSSGGAPFKAYHIETGGFDTHSLQALAGDPVRGTLAGLLGELALAVKAFLDDVQAWGRGGDVVVMVYSEFGRRVTENGALGTDHGHGGVAFLAGEPVRGGRYGLTPDLAGIQRPGESFYIPFDGRSTDFRRLYATVLENWLQVPSGPILNGSFAPLGAL